VDIARTIGDSFLKNLCAFVDHGEYQPLGDLLPIDQPALEAEPRRGIRNQHIDLGIGHARPRSLLINVEALASLLAEMAAFAQCAGACRARSECVAVAPSDIESR